MRLLVLLPAFVLFAGLASASTAPLQAQSISFTIVVGTFNTAGSTVGGGVCLGNRRVTDPKRYSGVRWSPDGRRFAFWRQTAESPTGGRADVFVADADGRNERNLTRSTSEFNWSPDWSPTGERIVYNAAGPDVTQLVTMRADGSDKRPLAATTLPRGGFAAQPSWSSADLIVYTRSDSSSGIWSLWTVRPDGSGHRLFMANGQDADWAPDGQRLVFTSGGDLFIGDGARLHQLTTSRELVEQGPQWSPDGRTIAAMSIDERDPKIYEPRDELLLLDAASGRSRILRGPYGAWSPTWRPSADPVPGQRPCVVEGTRRADVLRGTSRGDLIYARGGNDLIRSGAGDDVVFGNAGADVLRAGRGNDVLGAQDNRRDLVDGGAGTDRARVDRRRDRLRSVERLLR